MANGRNMSAVPLAVLAFGLLLSLAGICPAQNIQETGELVSSDLIEKTLTSGDPRLIAWGAHYAIATKNQEVVPQLLDVAERWQATRVDLNAEMGSEDDPSDQHDAIAAALDAIIQLHAQVPPSTLRNLAVDFPNQVAILLSRLPADESMTLRLEFYRMQPHTRAADNLQYVAAALLAQDPPAGFAADLFSGIRNRATIKITKPGYSEEGTYGTGSGGSCILDDTHQVGWPAFGIYELWEGKSSEPNSFTVIEGPDPVSARRDETRHGRTDACDNFTFVILGPEQRRNFVARWLGVDPDDIPWKSEATGTIVYRSNQQFYAELRQFIAREQEKYRSTGRALVAKNLMTAAEQEESLPHIELAFDDHRGANARWISEPDSLPPHVGWPKAPKHRLPYVTSDSTERPESR